MKNTITNAFVGKTFIDWVRSNYDVEHQHEFFFDLFKKACKKENVDLYTYDDSSVLTNILNHNRKTITYCEGVSVDANYLCEDSCHKLHGFNALTDIGFPYLYDEAIGSSVMYMIDDYDKKTDDEKSWLNSFSAYLSPKIMDRIVAMTKEFMGENAKYISDDVLKAVWGDESNESLTEWIASFQNLTPYSDSECYIADYLNINVIHPAMTNVIAGYDISDKDFDTLYDAVSSCSWSDILDLWSNKESMINEFQQDFGLVLLPREKKINETIAGLVWTKELSKFPDEVNPKDPVWWRVGSFSEGDLWMNNCDGTEILVTDNRILFRDF